MRMTLTQTLQSAILESGYSLKRLAALTGVERMTISRFVRDETSITLKNADKLAQFLELELCSKKGE